ncbi:hypothetical protein F5879DRAFT_926274 [Lentinula edodes]|nr:hypothetical protein F5879DRAFT_926274 [Lentinula edodes]
MKQIYWYDHLLACRYTTSAKLLDLENLTDTRGYAASDLFELGPLEDCWAYRLIDAKNDAEVLKFENIVWPAIELTRIAPSWSGIWYSSSIPKNASFFKVGPGESETITFKECFFLFAASIEPESGASFKSTETLKIHAVQHNDHGFQVLVPLTDKAEILKAETVGLNLKIGEGQKLTFKVIGSHSMEFIVVTLGDIDRRNLANEQAH